MKARTHSSGRERGFSLSELVVVIGITLVLAAVSAPSFMNAIHNSRLQGAASEFSGIVQMGRMRAVQDSRFYSVYVHASANNAPQEAFVDIYPQGTNQASGTGGLQINTGDPLAEIPTEVVEQPQSAAPNTAGLAKLLLPTNPNNLVPTDGSSTSTPITFGPEGLPCVPYQMPGGGTVCTTRGTAAAAPGSNGAVAYWVFFQDSSTQGWEAVTVTPAGRTEKWIYSGGTWAKL